MRAEHERLFVLVFLGLPDTVDVADAVHNDLQTGVSHPAGNQIAAFLLGVGCACARAVSLRINANLAQCKKMLQHTIFIHLEHKYPPCLICSMAIDFLVSCCYNYISDILALY